MRLMIKICGMREPGNILEAANLKPDLMGFVYYAASPRHVSGILNPETFAGFPPGIRKTGVFVNAGLDEIIGTVHKYSLDAVQLHGNESPGICRRLGDEAIQVIKAFNINESAGFQLCSEYVACTDYFLFDSSASGYGGSGNKFDWKILENYELGHPFFLSGGITPGDVCNITEISNPAFYGIDINSKFEVRPGVKDIEMVKKFMNEIRHKNKSL